MNVVDALKFLNFIQSEYGYTEIEEIVEDIESIMKNYNSSVLVTESKASTDDIKVYKYTDKSYIIIGDTKSCKDDFKTFGCKWMNKLSKDGFEGKCGWMFPATKLEQFKTKFSYKIIEN